MKVMGKRGGEVKAETGIGKGNLSQFVLLSHVCSGSRSAPGLAGRQSGPGPRESWSMTPALSSLPES